MGADVNVHSRIDGWTPLMYVCFWGDTGVPVAKYLLEHGADPCARDKLGVPVLSFVPEDASRLRKLIEEAVRRRCKGKQKAPDKNENIPTEETKISKEQKDGIKENAAHTIEY